MTWTELEHTLFVDGLKEHGKDFTSISNAVMTKSKKEVIFYYSMLKQKIGRNPEDDPDCIYYTIFSVNNTIQDEWSEEDHQLFIQAIKMHGKNWPMVKHHIKSKSKVEIF